MEDLEKIKAAIGTKLHNMGLELFEVKYNRAGRHSSLRVFVDRPEGGVTIGECELASHEISMVLDVENFSDSAYNLEVSSPGADRPIKSEKEFKRVMGKEVRVVYLDDNGKSQTQSGTVVGHDGRTLRLQTGTGEMALPSAFILSAKIELQF